MLFVLNNFDDIIVLDATRFRNFIYLFVTFFISFFLAIKLVVLSSKNS